MFFKSLKVPKFTITPSVTQLETKNLNHKGLDKYQSKIECRHLAAYTFRNGICETVPVLHNINAIANTAYLADNICDNIELKIKRNYIICDLEKINFAFHYLKLNVKTIDIPLLVLAEKHALSISIQNASQGNLYFYDPNKTNQYLTITGKSDLELAQGLQSDSCSFKDYLSKVRSCVIIYDCIDNPTLNAKWSQNPVEALGWCMRQSDKTGFKVLLNKLNSIKEHIKPATQEFLRTSFNHASHAEQAWIIKTIMHSKLNQQQQNDLLEAINS